MQKEFDFLRFISVKCAPGKTPLQLKKEAEDRAKLERMHLENLDKKSGAA